MKSSINVLPIYYLDTWRKEQASQGRYYKIRYRGPRNTPLDAGRSRNARQSTCLKANATYFAVYHY